MATQRLIFDTPEDTAPFEIIDEILKQNGLEEQSSEFIQKYDEGLEPRLIIVRDAATTLFHKRISEEKVVELLAKHLSTSPQVAADIVKDIKEKLLPYAKMVDPDTLRPKAEKEADPEEGKELFREELLRRIEAGRSARRPAPKASPLPAGVKKPEIEDVEENAEKIIEKRFPTAPPQNPQTFPREKPPEKKDFPRASQYKEEDPYRETPQ